MTAIRAHCSTLNLPTYLASAHAEIKPLLRRTVIAPIDPEEREEQRYGKRAEEQPDHAEGGEAADQGEEQHAAVHLDVALHHVRLDDVVDHADDHRGPHGKEQRRVGE